MKKDRRSFLRQCGIITLSAGCGTLLGGCHLAAEENKPVHRNYPLLNPLQPEEKTIIEKSFLANQDVLGYVQEGYGCGEIMVQAYIKKHQLSEDLLHSVVAFKNGFAQRDTCCLYSTAVMLFGLSVRNLSSNRRERYRMCEEKIKRFRNWWMERSPLNCDDIFPACKNGYENQYKKVAYVVEQIAEGK